MCLLYHIISAPLRLEHLPYLARNIKQLITSFDSSHRVYGNKEYADMLWEVRNIIIQS